MKIDIIKTEKSKLDTLDFDNLGFGNFISDHMFSADYRNGKWLDLQITPFRNLSISPINLTLHYGQSIFEGMKANINNLGEIVILNPQKNADRFRLSAERMCMEPVPKELFLKAINELVSIDWRWIPNKEKCSLYIRPFLIAMDNSLGVQPSKSYKFIIVTGPVGALHDNPIKLQTLSNFSRATIGGIGEAKTAGNYAASLLPTRISHQNGFNEVLWLDDREKRNIQEVGTMNIFFVINNVIVTPKINGAILKGIMREMVIELLESKGYKIEIRQIKIDEIILAFKNKTLQEVFGTGTAAVITKVSEINHENTQIKINPTKENSISDIIENEIERIKKGEISDSFNWITKINKQQN